MQVFEIRKSSKPAKLQLGSNLRHNTGFILLKAKAKIYQHTLTFFHKN